VALIPHSDILTKYPMVSLLIMLPPNDNYIQLQGNAADSQEVFVNVLYLLKTGDTIISDNVTMIMLPLSLARKTTNMSRCRHFEMCHGQWVNLCLHRVTQQEKNWP